MFAIFLSKGMDPFYQNIASFPTILFTFLLFIVLFYWLIAVLGMVDIDVLDVDLDVDSGNGGEGGPNALAGMLMRFGLVGVPVTIVLSIVVLIGWLLCYYAVYFVGALLPDLFAPGTLIRYGIGLPIFGVVLFASLWITGFLIRPLKPLFKQLDQRTDKKVLGQTAIVRTSVVDAEFGEAALEDGGAGLILKVRATGDKTYAKGDRVVLIEHLAENNLFRVVSESEFKGL